MRALYRVCDEIQISSRRKRLTANHFQSFMQQHSGCSLIVSRALFRVYVSRLLRLVKGIRV